jgi:hypothetical protein
MERNAFRAAPISGHCDLEADTPCKAKRGRQPERRPVGFNTVVSWKKSCSGEEPPMIGHPIIIIRIIAVPA